jgi:hypothetical protein
MAPPPGAPPQYASAPGPPPYGVRPSGPPPAYGTQMSSAHMSGANMPGANMSMMRAGPQGGPGGAGPPGQSAFRAGPPPGYAGPGLSLYLSFPLSLSFSLFLSPFLPGTWV